ncbi:hypothetical protein PVIIG_05346 [Plasmodium vivax India VII]|uniref:VIR protein n=1 Tax=Plasmodium vivax India VII TaxID=1077284 RepID=A0A0J9S2W9_PLAVI|nr:hypothetical protein PVIIG_05346 [Plasmodium vivax India VII]
MDRESENLHNYYEKCNEIIVKEPKDKMILICKKYHRFLDKYLTWSKLNSKFDVSLLLSYWLLENLIKIYADRNSNAVIVGFSALQGIWADFFDYRKIKETHIKNCKPERDIVNHEDWEKRKKLYEYYVDYYSLFESAKVHNTFCEQYYRKIKEFPPLYEYFQRQCSTDGYKCPQFFYSFKNENREYKLEELPCHTQMERAIAAEAEAKDRPSQHQSGLEPGQAAQGDGYGLSGSEQGTPRGGTITETSGIEKKVTHTVLGAAPVLLTATMLYRYTPLGPWIRRFRGGTTNSMSAMVGVSPYTQETGDMFSDDSANFISYQPI